MLQASLGRIGLLNVVEVLEEQTRDKRGSLFSTTVSETDANQRDEAAI